MKEIYQLLSNAMNQEMRLSQIANNLANVSSPGFKRDDSDFENVLNATQAGQSALGAANAADVGWSSVVNAYTDFNQGELKPTGNTLDVAIDGDGFFTVQKDNNTYYTRAGNFKLNTQHELTTPSGFNVLDTSGRPIVLDPNRGTPTITPDGTILQKGTTVGRISVVAFDEPKKLTKFGQGGLFSAPNGLQPKPVLKPHVCQEMLENSNVNVIDEMVRMIQTERSYQVQQKIIQNLDDLTQRNLESARS